MMKRLVSMALIAAFVACSAAAAFGATSVKVAGDARIWGNSWTRINYTGWNARGTTTGDPLTIWERYRLRTDFIANGNLKFRAGIRVNNRAWGNDTFTVDNPSVAIDVYQAYLQFKCPGSDVEFTIGLQDVDLPVSAPGLLNSSPVFGGTRAAAALVTIPGGAGLKLTGGFIRFLDTNKDFDTTTTQVADEFDGYLMTLPIPLDGFLATPWAMLGVTGRNANYAVPVGNTPRSTNQSLATNLFPAASLAPGATFRNAQNLYWWAGASVALTSADPFKFYADLIYGQGNAGDRKANRRGGLFLDVAAEYTNLLYFTPQAAFWYSTGEDGSTTNGSERMPSVVGSWGPSTSFLFDSSQAFGEGSMGLNPMGSAGFALSLNAISFLQSMIHRLTFAYAWGTNSPRALRNANLLTGVGTYAQMGRDLTANEHVMGLNFDTRYDLYGNLALIAETGWAHGQFQQSVWGHRFVNQARNGDAWKVAFGLQYTF